MATDLERLVVQLSADIRGYENAMRKAQGVTQRQTRAIESQWARANRNIAAGFNGLSRAFATALAAGASARGAQQLVDTATRVENALKVAGLSGEELTRVYGSLRDSALRNAAPLESLVTLYSRATLVQKELGVSSEELENFTDRVALALRVNGQSAAESSGALLQLSQALGSATVRAEEFNSIQEGALPILQAVANGLKEAGGSVAALRKLVIDGKVSSQAFFRAFEAGAPILEDKVAGATLTISQRMENLKTVLIDAAGRFNRSTQAANTFGEAIDNIANFVSDIDFDNLISEIGEVIGQFRAGVEWANNFTRSLGEITGLENIGTLLTGGAAQRSFLGGALTATSSKALRERINSAFDGAVPTDPAVEQMLRDRFLGGTGNAPKGGRLGQKAFKPISITDPGMAAVGDGKGKKRRDNDLEREIKQLQERTAAIRAETAAMAGLNPLVNDYGFALEQAMAKQELLTAAKRAGIAVTPDLARSMDELAAGYARASAEAQQLAESQDRARQFAEDLADTAQGAFRSFISDILDGKSAVDALANSLGSIADRLIDIGLNLVFSNLFGGGGGGLLGGLFGQKKVGLFHTGGVAGQARQHRMVHPAMFAGAERYHNGGMAGLKPGEVPAILERGEIILPRGSKPGGSTFAPVYNIDARGAAPGVSAEIKAALEAYDRGRVPRLAGDMRELRKRGGL